MIMNNRKILGFSAFELLAVLGVISFIILITNKILRDINQNKEYNQLGDQSAFFSQLAIRYVNDNYRALTTNLANNQSMIIPYQSLSSYIPRGVSLTNKWQEKPCFYITNNTNNQLNTYVLIARTKSNNQIEKIDLSRVRQELGKNSGILTKINDNYVLEGGIENNLVLDQSAINNIYTNCGFGSQLPQYTLVIDISKDSGLFASIQGNIDKQSTYNTNDPSLKKSDNSLVTMQTNIYLDNVYKESDGVTAPMHVYQALDYGLSSVDGRRIQVKTAAATGVTVNNSQLNINNAGLQSGLISPMSHMIQAGVSCDSSELGKFAQDLNHLVISSQLQCTYNPTFCQGNGYCYLPIKTTSFDYQYTTPVSSAQCPVGTIVDNNQPSGNLFDKITCQNIEGWLIYQGLHGEATMCYQGVTGSTFCMGYEAVCTYSNGSQFMKQLQPGLIKLRCSNATSSYTVDNYSQ